MQQLHCNLLNLSKVHLTTVHLNAVNLKAMHLDAVHLIVVAHTRTFCWSLSSGLKFSELDYNALGRSALESCELECSALD